MSDALEILYPSGVDSLWVVPDFPMAGHPIEMKIELEQGGGNLYSFMIEDDSVAFVNKLYPHSLHDLMLLILDPPVKSSINDLSAATIAMLGRLVHRFVEYVSDSAIMDDFGFSNGRFHCCYNYDRDTIDRESGMSDKRFHIHLNYWTESELLNLRPQPFHTIKHPASRRTYLDPCAFLGSKIAYELLNNQLPIGSIMEPNLAQDRQLGLPIGLKIAFDDWSFLCHPAFGQLLQLIHTQLITCYQDLCCAFTDTSEPAPFWQRHELLPTARIIERIEALTYLSSEVKHDLSILARRLHTINPRLMQYFQQNRRHRVHHLAMNGLNYAIGFYTQQSNTPETPLINQGPVYLVIQTKLFSEIGGAGLAYMGNIPMIRIRRGSKTMDTAQLNTRKRFQMDFIQQAKTLLEA